MESSRWGVCCACLCVLVCLVNGTQLIVQQTVVTTSSAQQTDQMPSPRCDTRFIKLNSTTFLSIGGENGDPTEGPWDNVSDTSSGNFQEPYLYDVTSNLWTRMTTTGTGPGDRAAAAVGLTTDGSTLVVWGSGDSAVYALDIASWAWSTPSWVSEAPYPDGPHWRTYVQFVNVNDKFVMIGGLEIDGVNFEQDSGNLDDIWVLDTNVSPWSWSCVSSTCYNTSVTVPISVPSTFNSFVGLGPVEGHSVVLFNSTIYIWGGYRCDTTAFALPGGTNCFNPYVVTLDTTTWQLTALTSVTGTGPLTGRQYHAAGAVGNLLLIFGGNYNDISQQSYFYNDVYIFDTAANSWVNTSSILGTTIDPRWSAQTIENNGQLYVFSGCNANSYFNDLSILQTGAYCNAKYYYNFTDSTCEPCPAGTSSLAGAATCFDVYQFDWELGVFWAFGSLAIIGIVLCLGIGIFFTMNRNHKTVRSASLRFCYLMLGGAIFCYITVLLLYPRPDDDMCRAQFWMGHTGFVLLFGALFAKTRRIAILFNNKKLRKLRITDFHVLRVVLSALAVTFLYLIIWTAQGRIRSESTLISGRTYADMCTFDGEFWSKVPVAVEGLIILYGAYLSFITRNAVSEYNESKYIGASIYSILFVGVIVIPLVWLVVTTLPNAVLILECMGILVGTSGVVLLLFVPKIYNILRNIQDDGFGATASHTIRTAQDAWQSNTSQHWTSLEEENSQLKIELQRLKTVNAELQDQIRIYQLQTQLQNQDQSQNQSQPQSRASSRPPSHRSQSGSRSHRSQSGSRSRSQSQSTMKLIPVDHAEVPFQTVLVQQLSPNGLSEIISVPNVPSESADSVGIDVAQNV
eukprot:GILK01003204.1.p1 GENE.GILK01003204.1~~GILK01003204.1.p1  ORF type:complete len:853 (-),score=95.15 GILK01003204.1:498-3056(-)